MTKSKDDIKMELWFKEAYPEIYHKVRQQTAEEIFKDLNKIGIEEYDCEFEEYNKIKQKYLKEVLK